MKLLICFLLVFQCFAVDVLPLKKGEAAPYSGFLLNTENLKEMQKINENGKLLKKKVIILQELGEIKDAKVGLYKDEANLYHKAYSKEQTKGTWKLIGGIVLGVLATSAAGYIYSKSVK